MIESIQVAKISASSIVVYNKQIEKRERTERQKENAVNLRDQEYNGFMSPKTKCKVRKMLDSWLTAVDLEKKRLKQGKYFMNSKVTFVTLTLSAGQIHDDNYIKRNLLNRFIIEAKRDWQVYNYFWRAEPQKNGNIHFHLLMDKFIPWKELRSKWNGIQSAHGYIKRFEAEWLHEDANSTDIHGLEEKKSVAAYVVKYCCKTVGVRKVEGRIWGCSDSLRKLTCYETELTNEVKKYIEAVEKDKWTKVIKKDDFTLIFCNNEKKLRQLSQRLYRDFKIHYQKVYSDLYTEEGRKKIQEEIAREKDFGRHSAPTNRDAINNRSRVLVSSQLSIFATSNGFASR